MIIIGEKLNSSIKSTYKAFENADAEWVKDMTRKQLGMGARYVDINAAMFADEGERLLWAVNAAVGVGANVCLDSADPSVIRYVLERVQLNDFLINSITLESARVDGMLPLITGFGASVVALPISDDGMPKDADERVRGGLRLAKLLSGAGVGHERIFIDILAESAATDHEAPRKALDAARELRERLPNIHLTMGLSNVSFGLPRRGCVNAAFLAAAVCCGADSAIMDALNPDLAMTLRAAELVDGRDEYAGEYLEMYRKLED